MFEKKIQPNISFFPKYLYLYFAINEMIQCTMFIIQCLLEQEGSAV